MKDGEQKTLRMTKWRRYMRKKYVIPALYLLIASIVLTGILYFKNDGENAETNLSTPKDTPTIEEESLAVSKQKETLKWPVKDQQTIEIKRPFYDQASTEAEREKAIVMYDNVYYQNKGIDLSKQSGESFDVLAALSGTVTKVEQDSLFGQVVTIEHTNNVTTHYQALTDVNVTEGQVVKQGDVIAKAGRNTFNKDLGVHLHFEVRVDGKAQNPAAVFNQSISSLKAAEQEEQPDEKREEKPEEDNKAPSNSQQNTTEETPTLKENQSNNA